MRKRVVLLLAAIMLLGCVCALAEKADLTGDWKMDLFGFPMYFYFHEDGTYEGLIDVAIQFDDGNGFSGTWEFDGTTLTIHGDDDQTFTWDGEKLTGVVEGAEVVLQRAIEPEQPAQ